MRMWHSSFSKSYYIHHRPYEDETVRAIASATGTGTSAATAERDRREWKHYDYAGGGCSYETTTGPHSNCSPGRRADRRKQ